MGDTASARDDEFSFDPGNQRHYWRLAETALAIGAWRWNLTTGGISCSARAAALLGVSNPDALCRDELVALFDPDDRARVAETLDRASCGQTIAIEANRSEAGGGMTRLRLTGSIPERGYGAPDQVFGLVMATDAHASRQATSHLLAAIVSCSDDAIISKTPEGIITSWNPAAQQMFGYSAEEMIGQPIARLAPPDRESEMPAILDRLRRGERIDHYETTRRHKNGQILQISLSVSPIHDENGVLIGASKVARDVTAARQAVDALRGARRRLREQRAELLHGARLAELGQMAASLAHEVNQPLTAITTYLRAAQRLRAADDAANLDKLDTAIGRAREQALRASEIIRGLRALTKRGESEPTAEAANAIVEEAVSLATIDAAPRGVRVQLDLDASCGLVLAARIQIQQVLLNLIRNALEAMDGQKRKQLRVATVRREDVVEVRVTDSGPGLSPEVTKRLFQPFVTTKNSGMGIGLSICQRIIEAHGGRIWVESNPDGGGTVFAFALRSAPNV